jgi:alcohol dehydrogenase class IV
VETLAALAGPRRLGELGVAESDLPDLAADAARRGGNLANPEPASPQQIEQLLREVF